VGRGIATQKVLLHSAPVVLSAVVRGGKRRGHRYASASSDPALLAEISLLLEIEQLALDALLYRTLMGNDARQNVD